MAGYTRYDTSNNIATGNVINAADLDGEFDALVAAFHASTGHVHDGTAANGAPITKLGPAQEYVGNGTSFSPKTTAVYDLGTSSLRWNNLQVVNLNASNTAIEDGIIVSGRSGGTSSYRVSIVPTTLTASRTVTLPDSTGIVILDAGSQTISGAKTFTASNSFQNASGQTFLASTTTTQDGIVINGRAGGTNSYRATFVPTTLTASRTLTIPDVSGTLLTTGTTVTVSQGGTGAATLTANNVILGNGTSAVQFVAPGTNGNILTSNGTTWTSAAAPASLLGDTDSASPFETSLGYQAGNVTTGVNNTFIGYQAGLLNSTGTDNLAVGFQAFDANTTGIKNTALGSVALSANTNGGSNVAVGYAALQINTTGQRNVAIGESALVSSVSTSNSVAVGHNALQANTTGQENVGVGYRALYNNSVGSYNLALGSGALDANQDGSNNTANGYRALFSNLSGARNTAVGYQALDANTTGVDNVAVGANSLGANDGSNSVAIGASALLLSTASSNTAIGAFAGDVITTGANNIIIGPSADPSSATANYQYVIGSSVTGQADNNITIGSPAGKIYNAFTVNATWTQTSDGTMKNIVGPDVLGLSFIKRLNPVKYTWKPRNELPQDHPYYNPVNPVDTTTVIHGFVAQEVKAALDAEGCDTFNGWDQGSDGIQAISREMFISPLVKAVQELAAQVEALQAEIAILKAQP